MITTPKGRFQANKENIKKLREIVDSDFFQGVLDMTLLQMNADASGRDNPDPMRYFYRLEGANLFVQTLLRMAEIQNLKQEPQRTNLRW